MMPLTRVWELSKLIFLSNYLAKHNKVCLDFIQIVTPTHNLWKSYAYYLKSLPFVILDVVARRHKSGLLVLMLSDVAPYLYATLFILVSKILRLKSIFGLPIWYDPPRSKVTFFNTILKKLLKFYDLIVCPSRKAYLNARKHVPSKVALLHYYFSVPYSTDCPNRAKCNYLKLVNELKKKGATIYVYIGRFLKVKGLNYLLQTFNEISQKYPRAYLVLVGDGPERELIINYSRKKGNMLWLGWLKHPCTDCIIKAGDVGVYTSIATEKYFEEFGIAPLEYAMYGKPLIISNTVGCSHDIVINKYNGFIVRQRNRFDLFKAIKHYLVNPNVLRLHGARSMQIWRKKFSARAISIQILEAVVKILSNK